MAEGFKIELRDMASLKPYERNARTHPRDQLDQIKALIELVGFTNPIIADAQGIIAGHGRLLAAQELQAEGKAIMGPGKRYELPKGKLPVIDATGMGKAERKAYILADNQVALNSSWDMELLRGELLDLREMKFDLDLTGFSSTEVSEYVQFGSSGTAEEQARLDKLEPMLVKCPQCQHEFNCREV